jgi:hypothetical protein
MFGKRVQKRNGSKVLVCSLGEQDSPQLKGDAAVYDRYFRHVSASGFGSVAELLRGIDAGYDVVHLFGSLGPNGLIAADAALAGSDLISRCCERGVKLLWVARENSPEDYVAGLPAGGKRVNLIMTIRRNAGFEEFLSAILSRVSRGETLPHAWTKEAPQVPNGPHRDLPSCIFFAGWPAAMLHT